MEMWLCGTPYLPGLEPCWYPPLPANSSHLLITSLDKLILSFLSETLSALSSLTLSLSLLSSLSLQEARAERDQQGEASITGSPSPPPGTRLQVQARQDALLGRLTLKKRGWREARHKKKKEGKYQVRLRRVFTLFICFRTFHFITVFLFSVLFLLEHCECYFRWLFVLLLLTLHLIDSVETNQFEWELDCDCHVQ